MPTPSDPLTVQAPPGHALHGQFRHALMLAALLPGAWAIAAPVLDDGAWLGISDRTWFIAAIAVPIIQQLLVVLFWRAQLCYGAVTRLFGDAGFVIWGVVFFPLLLARPALALAVGLADPGTLGIPPILAWTVGLLMLPPVFWTGHSVMTHFGMARALGGDHFFERYRTMPMVKGGIFAYTSNAMYGVAFLGFWSIALLTGSRAAMAVALFEHAYIWVHWYCTEQPDGVVLYGASQETLHTELN